ncbi:hypothetical protein ACSSS7_008344 [Eimeria intestinalis]
MGGSLSQIVFQPPRYPDGPPHDADFIPLTTKGGETIQSLHIKGSGKPSERGVYESIEAAFDYLTKELHIHPSSIIAYGRSLVLGVAAAAAAFVVAAALAAAVAAAIAAFAGYLCFASGWLCHELGGLILQSALLSIHRVALQLRISLPFDMFELYKRAPLRTSPLWVEGAGHNNLEVTARRRFFAALRRFFDLVALRNSQLQQQQQQQQQQQEEEQQQQQQQHHREESAATEVNLHLRQGRGKQEQQEEEKELATAAAAGGEGASNSSSSNNSSKQ